MPGCLIGTGRQGETGHEEKVAVADQWGKAVY
jgi:hypothetical protein